MHYNTCSFKMSSFLLHTESAEYGACSFNLNNKVIVYRESKITPTKTGQFVTIWQRNSQGITAPYHFTDAFDFIIVTSKQNDDLGQFIFPKKVLATKGIITQNTTDGKRGIRVYPPWDIVNNKQAEKTQSWQVNYFIDLNKKDTICHLLQQLLSNG